MPGLLGQASVLIRQRRAYEACGKLEDAEEQRPDRPGPKIALATLLAQENKDESRYEDENRREERRAAPTSCADARGRGAESDAAALACRAQLAAGRRLSPLGRVIFGRSPAAQPLWQPHRHTRRSPDRDAPDRRGRDHAQRAAEGYILTTAQRTSSCTAPSTPGATPRRRWARCDPPLLLATGPGNDPLAVALAYELEEQGYSAEAEQVLRTRLAGGGPAKDDHLRLGLAWILLTRGERAQSPALLEEAIDAGKPSALAS